MKCKYDPDRQHKALFPVDFSVMPCLDERSHENSPVSSLSTEFLSEVNESKSSAEMLPRPTNSPKLIWSPPASLSPILNGSFDDSGFEVTPPNLKGSSVTVTTDTEKLKNYIKELEDNNKSLEAENKNLRNEMWNKIKFLTDLQTRYDECIDTVVNLNNKIYQLENGRQPNSSGLSTVTIHSSAKEQEIANVKKDIKEVKEVGQQWRVRSNLLDVDNNLLKTQIDELKETITELMRGNGAQSRPRSNSKLVNHVSPKTRKLANDPTSNKPERDVSIAITDTIKPKQCLPSLKSKTSKLPPLIKSSDTNTSGQSVTKTTNVRSNTPILPPIECPVRRPKYQPRPPSHPDSKLHTSSTRSATPIINPTLPPINNNINLQHLPLPPSKPKIHKTRIFKR